RGWIFRIYEGFNSKLLRSFLSVTCNGDGFSDLILSAPVKLHQKLATITGINGCFCPSRHSTSAATFGINNGKRCISRICKSKSMLHVCSLIDSSEIEFFFLEFHHRKFPGVCISFSSRSHVFIFHLIGSIVFTRKKGKSCHNSYH